MRYTDANNTAMMRTQKNHFKVIVALLERCNYSYHSKHIQSAGMAHAYQFAVGVSIGKHAQKWVVAAQWCYTGHEGCEERREVRHGQYRVKWPPGFIAQQRVYSAEKDQLTRYDTARRR